MLQTAEEKAAVQKEDLRLMEAYVEEMKNFNEEQEDKAPLCASYFNTLIFGLPVTLHEP